ncbi:MAG: hypothetical protein GQ570_11190 [Helicobacteraceae bacterium]|nr:hypothetical protein [Helicobacteraceae bacterium]
MSYTLLEHPRNNSYQLYVPDINVEELAIRYYTEEFGYIITPITFPNDYIEVSNWNNSEFVVNFDLFFDAFPDMSSVFSNDTLFSDVHESGSKFMYIEYSNTYYCDCVCYGRAVKSLNTVDFVDFSQYISCDGVVDSSFVSINLDDIAITLNTVLQDYEVVKEVINEVEIPAPIKTLNGNNTEFYDGDEVLVVGRTEPFTVVSSDTILTSDNAYTVFYKLEKNGAFSNVPEALLTKYVIVDDVV